MYEALITHLRECAKLDPAENTYKEAADAIEDLEKSLAIALLEYQIANNKWLMTEEYAKQKQRWIPVTERLPEDRQRVLAISLSKISPRRSCYRLVYFSNNLESVDNLEFEGESRCGFYYYDSEYGFCEVDDVSHWMPLPQPPESEGE